MTFEERVQTYLDAGEEVLNNFINERLKTEAEYDNEDVFDYVTILDCVKELSKKDPEFKDYKDIDEIELTPIRIAKILAYQDTFYYNEDDEEDVKADCLIASTIDCLKNYRDILINAMNSDIEHSNKENSNLQRNIDYVTDIISVWEAIDND